jgi:hypothetical protein
MRRVVSGVAAALVLAGAASANPNGAPWGSADPASPQNCASCHFDYDPALDSELLSLNGLPGRVAAGKTYALSLSLAASDAVIAGFMLSASAGAFFTEGEGLEAKGAEVRSAAPVAAGEGASWRVSWTAPEDLSDDVFFYVAVNGANDDASPFGDVVHFKTFEARIEN